MSIPNTPKKNSVAFNDNADKNETPTPKTAKSQNNTKQSRATPSPRRSKKPLFDDTPPTNRYMVQMAKNRFDTSKNFRKEIRNIFHKSDQFAVFQQKSALVLPTELTPDRYVLGKFNAAPEKILKDRGISRKVTRRTDLFNRNQNNSQLTPGRDRYERDNEVLIEEIEQTDYYTEEQQSSSKEPLGQSNQDRNNNLHHSEPQQDDIDTNDTNHQHEDNDFVQPEDQLVNNEEENDQNTVERGAQLENHKDEDNHNKPKCTDRNEKETSKDQNAEVDNHDEDKGTSPVQIEEEEEENEENATKTHTEVQQSNENEVQHDHDAAEAQQNNQKEYSYDQIHSENNHNEEKEATPIQLEEEEEVNDQGNENEVQQDQNAAENNQSEEKEDPRIQLEEEEEVNDQENENEVQQDQNAAEAATENAENEATNEQSAEHANEEGTSFDQIAPENENEADERETSPTPGNNDKDNENEAEQQPEPEQRGTSLPTENNENSNANNNENNNVNDDENNNVNDNENNNVNDNENNNVNDNENNNVNDNENSNANNNENNNVNDNENSNANNNENNNVNDDENNNVNDNENNNVNDNENNNVNDNENSNVNDNENNNVNDNENSNANDNEDENLASDSIDQYATTSDQNRQFTSPATETEAEVHSKSQDYSNPSNNNNTTNQVDDEIPLPDFGANTTDRQAHLEPFMPPMSPPRFIRLDRSDPNIHHTGDQLLEISLRPYLFSLTKKYGTPISTLRDIPQMELNDWQSMGFDWVWLYGAWQIGRYVIDYDLIDGHLLKSYKEYLPDWQREDVIGYPLCIYKYEVCPEVGTEENLEWFRNELKKRGIKLMLDFVPNDTAIDSPEMTSNPDFYIHSTMDPDDDQFDSSRFMSNHDGIAFGAGLNMPPMHFNAQLNIFNKKCRDYQIERLLKISQMCDGVRVHLAQYLINSHFADYWKNELFENNRNVVDVDYTNENEEFWLLAISKVRSFNPNFVFVAESYGESNQDKLIKCGFNYVYEKELLDKLVFSDVKGFRDLIFQNNEHITSKRMVHFVENHDEKRILDLFWNNDRMACAASAALLTLPGIRLFNFHQWLGYSHQIHVNLRRSFDPHINKTIMLFYVRLFRVLDTNAIRFGEWTPKNVYESDTVIAWKWVKDKQHILVTINFSNERSGGRIILNDAPTDTREITVHELIANTYYTRDPQELIDEGLHLSLDKYETQIFEY